MESAQPSYPFPVEQKLQPEFLTQNFWKCHYTSAKDQLHYWIVLPNNVKPTKLEPVPILAVQLTNIGQYNSIDNGPYLEVEMVTEHVAYDINASDWLLKKIVLTGESILEFREIEGRSTGKYLDVLTIKKTAGGEEIISRFTALKDHDQLQGGANLFCVKAACIANDYETLADTILQIVTNWDLINKSDWQMAESLTPFHCEVAEPVSFYVPVSWQIKFQADNNSSFSRFVFSHEINNENKGVINGFFYDALSATNVTAVYDRSFGRFTHLKYELSALEKLRSLNPSIKELWSASGFIEREEENFAALLEINIIKTVNGWYYFETIGPKPNLENYCWEINKRCTEMILDSFNNMSFEKVQLSGEPLPENPINNPESKPSNKWLPDQWSVLTGDNE